MRLRYALIVLLRAVLASVALAACLPDEMTQQETISVAKSHMVGEPAILTMQLGLMGELAPQGMQVTEPNRRVWAVTLRGTFATDCRMNALGNFDCPPEPKLGILVLDAKDGSFLGSSVITFVPPGQPLPS